MEPRDGAEPTVASCACLADAHLVEAAENAGPTIAGAMARTGPDIPPDPPRLAAKRCEVVEI